MRIYKVTGSAITIHSGTVQIDTDQFKRREFALSAVSKGDGIYNVIRPFQFKSGETFGYDGPSLGKAVGLQLSEAIQFESEESEGTESNTEAQEALSEVTLAELANMLELPTLKQTKTLLKEKYDYTAGNGDSLLPENLLNQVMDDHGLAFEGE